MTSILLPCPQRFPGCRHGDEMIASSAGRFAEFDFVGIPPEIGVECQRDEVLLDVFRFNVVAGEPPGAIRGAGASRSPQWRAVGRREDDQGLVLGDRPLARFGDVGVPGDVPPRAFPALGLDHVEKAQEIAIGCGLGRLLGLASSQQDGTCQNHSPTCFHGDIKPSPVPACQA